ncbi:DUF4238 domain-containing protein [Vibrio parahaemolyticus]|uniref:DUF4238 domain-containing protein n=1 Tax=Vibrio parahaemolyticus TaxID=670 RepID=UPI003B68449E
MASNKKHHFVPQFYLKNFSLDGKSVSLFNKTSQKIVHTAPIKTQCYRDYFYGKDLTLEKSLGELEGKAADLLREVQRTISIPERNNPMYDQLLWYVAVQSSRTQYAADEMFQIRELSSQNGFLKPLSGSERPEAALNYAKRMFAGFYSLSSKLVVNHTAEKFITSDNPCVFYNVLTERIGCDKGCHVNSVGLIIILPISPEMSIIFYDDAVYKFGDKKTRVIELKDSSDAIELNKLQLVSAEQNVYFLSTASDPVKYHGSAKKHYRTKKINIIEKTDKFGVNATRVNIETGMKLSFLTLKKKAKVLIKSRDRSILEQGRDENLTAELLYLFQRLYDGFVNDAEFEESFWELAKKKSIQMQGKA